MTSFFCWLILLTNIFSDGNQEDNKRGNTYRRIDYDLSAPDRILVLPPALHEISGITEVDASSIACIQDENGIVFIHDINKNEITRRFIFGSEGDYEDIARVDKTLYILRSDEVLIEIADFKSDKFERTTYFTGIPGKDTEALCYDKKNNRLLLVPKEISDDKSENKDKLLFYGFDLATKKLIKGPVLSFDRPAIERFALDNNIKVPMKGKKGGKEKPDIKLRISAIGIHPITNRLFAISGTEKILFVFDLSGNIEYLERLDRDLFQQPEGITFMKNGDMYISNEGRNKSPTLVRFNYKPEARGKSGTIKS